MPVLTTREGSAPPVVGVLGGGQLGRMMAAAAHRLGVELVVLDPQGAASPAGQFGVRAVAGSFTSAADIAALAAQCDVLTVEIEHVNAAVLAELQTRAEKPVAVHPSPATIALIQDKFTQKQFFAKVADVHVAPFQVVASRADAVRIGGEFGYPYMLKSRLFAYDGKGNAVVTSASDVDDAFNKLGVREGEPIMLYAEQWVPFTKELAVMVVKADDDVRAYPVVETTQKDSICDTVLAPAQIPADTYAKAKQMAFLAISQLEGNGIYGVELFLTADGNVLLNEIAPRPHNSGHYTIEACETDQFEQHLRAVCGLPLGGCDLRVNCSLMVNVLGAKNASESESYAQLRKCLSVPGAIPHFYGKSGGVRAGRKLGHFTLVANSIQQLKERATLIDPEIAQNAGLTHTSDAVVGIVMGSDSDLPTMAAAAEILEKFHVPYELSIVSAHRTPGRMYEYAQSAFGRGLQVIIAGAGGAAHLPGMIAALTPLPVIGVPVKTSTMNGQDSLLSIVQMPRGVPVATVAIGNSTNAGLLAVRMLGGQYLVAMEEFLEAQRLEVDGKVEKMSQQGWKEYMKNMPSH
ncbi:Phosphoribosylaminoimidazole carboxylase, atpase subunit [Globisporangium polare]